MGEEILKCLAIVGSSMVKFIMGPILGRKFDYALLFTCFLTCCGMMASVYLFSSLLGKKIHNWMMSVFFKNRRLFTKANRRKVKIWRAYGMKGVAFLTPILFSPIGGTLIATSFGEHRKKIFMYMLISAIFWSIVISFGFSLIDLHEILHLLKNWWSETVMG